MPPKTAFSACFPRSCGDIPSGRPGCTSGDEFPPFMRGYTCARSPFLAQRLVSPVHAGIYLQGRCLRASRRGFPRSCGDIPCGFLTGVDQNTFPPFMRGYTLPARQVGPVSYVSPVHAGIYPPGISCPAFRAGFPRSCGDIPGSESYLRSGQ